MQLCDDTSFSASFIVLKIQCLYPHSKQQTAKLYLKSFCFCCAPNGHYFISIFSAHQWVILTIISFFLIIPNIFLICACIKQMTNPDTQTPDQRHLYMSNANSDYKLIGIVPTKSISKFSTSPFVFIVIAHKIFS